MGKPLGTPWFSFLKPDLLHWLMRNSGNIDIHMIPSEEGAQPKRESIEERLARELRFAGLDKENLKELVEIAAAIQKGGLRRFKAFPKGIPVPDGLRVTGVVEAPELAAFLGKLLPSTPRLGGVVVFPYGIPLPDVFRVNIDIGATAEAGSLG